MGVLLVGAQVTRVQAQTGGQVETPLRCQVEAALRRDLDDVQAMNGQPARLQMQSVDLNGDGRADAIALMDHPFSCGSRGCAVHVFVVEDASLRRVGDILANDELKRRRIRAIVFAAARSGAVSTAVPRKWKGAVRGAGPSVPKPLGSAPREAVDAAA
ncbi:MAG: hypothetical protein RLZZ187_2125 [Pseudomonadota bacterium]|jgi:hypothetical protein